MDKVSSLRIAVQTGDLLKAQRELDKLTAKGLQTEKATQKLEKSFRLTASSISLMGVAMTGFVALAGTQKLIKYADAMTQINSKLKLVTKSTEDLMTVEAELFKISQNARVGYEDTADLYARMGRSVKNTTISQKELLSVTDTISKSLIISGSSAESANAALVQLGQGFAADALRGQELNSVMEQTPRLAQAMAEGLGIGLGELRKIAAEGELTTEKTINAILKSSKSVNDEFEQMTMTVGQSLIKVDNSFLNLVGNLNDATGATNAMALAFSDFANVLDENSQEIKDWGRFTYATLDRTMDGFNLLYEVVENTAQNAVSGISALVYGTLAPITKMLRVTTEGLNSIGFSSNENLINALELEIATYELAEKAQQDIASNTQEMIDAAYKYNITIEERFIALTKEEEIRKLAASTKKELLDSQQKEIELTKEQLKLQQDLESRAKAQWGESVVEDHEAEMERIQAIADLETKTAEDLKNSLLDIIEGAKSPLEELNEKQIEQFEIIKDGWGESSEMMQKYYKIWEKEQKNLSKKDNKDDVKAIKKAQKSELDGIIEITNAGARLFDQDSKGYKAVTALEIALKTAKEATMLADQIQAAQAVANSAAVTTAKFSEAGANATASVTAAGSGDPYSGIGRVIAMMALMGTAMTMFGGSGSSSTAYTSTSIDPSQRYDDSIEDTEAMYELILNKHDREIELLESIDNHTGEAVSYSLDRAGVEYQKATTLAILEAGSLSGTKQKNILSYDLQSVVESELSKFGEYASLVSVTSRIEHIYENTALGSVTTSANVEDLNLGELLTFLEYLNTNDLLEDIGYTETEYATMVDSIQQVTHDFTVSVLESMEVLSDYADDMKGTFDKLTESDFYKNDTLNKALNDVENLLDGESLSSYLQTQIAAITELENTLSNEDIALLLSTDQGDIIAQRELINSIQDETNSVLDDGVIAALNYQDEIMLVADAMVEATEMFEDSLDSLRGTANSLQGTIDTLRNATVGESYQYEKYKQSMALSQSLLASGNMDAFQDEVKNTQSLSSILSSGTLFENDRYGYQQTSEQSIAANQFELLQQDTLTQVDVLIENRDIMMNTYGLIEELRTILDDSKDIQEVSLVEQQTIRVA